MIYLDTSAVIKLLVAGPESAALVDWLAAHDTEVIVSSALLRVEPFGALHRINAAGRSAPQHADRSAGRIHCAPRRANPPRAGDFPDELTRPLDRCSLLQRRIPAARRRRTAMAAKRVGLLLFDGADLLDAGGPYEVFLTANRLAVRRGDDPPFDVLTASPTGEPVTAHGGLGLVPTARADAMGPLDVVVVPGMIDVQRLTADDQLLAAVRSLADGADVVSSVCTGSFLLAAAGLTGGRTVTTHHEDVPELRGALGDEAVRTARWVDAGDVVTGGALTAGIAMALHLVERFTTRRLATATARQLAYHWDPEDGSLS